MGVEPMIDVIRFNDFSYAYQDAGGQVLHGITLAIRSGECHCLGGTTGSCKTSLALAFLPGMVFVKIVPEARIVQMFSAVLPYRMAFIMATCLNFLPLLLAEMKSIQEGQVLRGAKILPKDLVNPLNWLDVIHCLVVPVMIQTMNLSAQIALAAKARDFGMVGQRTSWPGEVKEEGQSFNNKGIMQ